MPSRIIILSGPIGAGKSELTDQLVRRHGAHRVGTSDLIRRRISNARASLQAEGDRLDRETGGNWVKSALAEIADELPPEALLVVDSVRIPEQITAIRDAFGNAAYHIHLTAPDHVLAERFATRDADKDKGVTFEEARKQSTEKKIGRLTELADLVIDTSRCTKDDVCVRATALLGFYPRSLIRNVDVLVGGQYGSEGKGNIVGHIAPEYSLLVRVGGPNAGHKVYAAPEPDAFFHIPSGANRAPNARLLLGAGAVLYVPKLLKEIQEHQIGVERLTIDPQAMIIEDADKEEEAIKLASISSTAQGVGAASARKIMGRGGQAKDAPRLAKDVEELRPYIGDGQALLEQHYLSGERILLEGTQGTSLSMHHGQYPWVTSRDTTVSGCLADAGISPSRVRRTVMVCRTYPIRVGGPSGPMGNELTYEELARRSGLDLELLTSTEKTTTTKKQRRFAEFDWSQLKKSTMLNGPTDIAVTFVDYIDKENQKAFRFDQLTLETLRFIEEVERVSGVPVTMISTKFDWRNVIDRRSW